MFIIPFVSYTICVSVALPVSCSMEHVTLHSYLNKSTNSTSRTGSRQQLLRVLDS